MLISEHKIIPPHPPGDVSRGEEKKKEEETN